MKKEIKKKSLLCITLQDKTVIGYYYQDGERLKYELTHDSREKAKRHIEKLNKDNKIII